MKVKCPTCNKISAWEDNPWRPFCSQRCRMLDLGAWADGEYRIAGERANVNDDEKEYNNYS